MLENCSTAKSVETFLVPVSVKEQTSAGVCDSCVYVYKYCCAYVIGIVVLRYKLSVYTYVPIFHYFVSYF